MIPPRIRGGGNSPGVGRGLAAPVNVSSTTLQAPQQQNMQQQQAQRLLQQAEDPFFNLLSELEQQEHAEDQFVNLLAKKLMDNCTPAHRAKFQSEVNAWPDKKKQQILQEGADPLFFHFRQHAKMLYKSGKVQSPKQQGANPMEEQQPLDMQDPIGQFESTFDLSDYRAIEAQDSNSPTYQLPFSFDKVEFKEHPGNRP